MNKEQFLDELEKLLQDIDSIERDEALNYNDELLLHFLAHLYQVPL